MMGLLSGDYSQIEARVLSSWAGQQDQVEGWRLRLDGYKRMAVRIYGVPEHLINSNQRFMGKQGVLSCGFQVGKFGFQNNLKVNFDIDMSLEECDRIVKAYRSASPKVVALWANVEKLAKKVVLERPKHFVTIEGVDKIHMRMHDKWLLMRLPSGRCLWYFEPELLTTIQYEERVVPGQFLTEDIPIGSRQQIVYWGRDVKRGGMWCRVDTYGGKLVENGVQAMARDVMAEGMLRLEAAGFEVFMQVHDDIVAPGRKDQVEEFQGLMEVRPKWWQDLPLNVDAHWMKRYGAK